MISVFNYLDFRAFLKDFFKEQKSLHSCFSYQYLSNKAGFNNKGFIYNIINGTKRLSSSHVFKLCSAMDLSKQECGYFEALVAYNQAATAHEQSHYFQKLFSLSSQSTQRSATQIINSDQYAYYSKWYHSAIRSLIGLYPDKNDAKWLSKKLRPSIKGWEVRRSIKLLLRLGLLRTTAKGTLELSNPIVSTGPDAQASGLLDFYLQHLDLASDALQNIPREKRRFEGVTLGISRESYDRICAEFALFTEKILSIARENKAADSVYQCMLQLYPLTKNVIKEKSDETAPK
jgi:uncharacterized protein (TIGR02147 family)